MEELKKIVRVMKKLDVDAPHEVMLTIDASTGQNAISQAKLFHEAVGLTGITLTKLDGTAKGGRDLLGGRSVRHSDSLYWRRASILRICVRLMRGDFIEALLPERIKNDSL
ncbi:signal recognition particle-docking protein FtsY [Klebsiella pneumoniae subsp. ozaenae]|uniref:Signal recognition particle-docking protein FtsY n=1 Tax=Klebsiella pneumoniae subsp. ozaenae TaxID=574 RepID=A0A378AMJ5_KLEPO|nr:signal recognition particle-docking protein FtsY [Klebsiella pneumoniae subsp. ozaenae]